MRNTLIIPLLFTLSAVFGQTSQKVVIIDNSVDPGMVDEIKLPPSKVKGSVYYTENWNIGKIYLNSGQILLNFPIRYDVENNRVEIRAGNTIKVCEWSQYSKFEWMDQELNDSVYFYNSSHFIYQDGTPPIGALRILYNGETKVFAKPYVKILNSNYAPTVDIGDRDHKMVHRDAYAILYNGFIMEFKNKKELLDIIENKTDLLKNYMKKNSLKATKGEDLVQAMVYYDRIKN